MDRPGPQTRKGTGEVIQPIPQAQTSDLSGEHFVDVLVPQIRKPAGVDGTPAELVVDVPVPLGEVIQSPTFLARRFREQTVTGVKGLSKERLQQGTGEPFVDVPVLGEVPQIRKETGEVTQPMPQIMEEIMKVIQLVLQERTQECIVEETINVLVPQMMEETIELVKHIPQEQVQCCIVEQTIDAPVPPMEEEIIEVVKHIPQEQVQSHTVEALVTVPIPWIPEETGQVTQLIPQKPRPSGPRKRGLQNRVALVLAVVNKPRLIFESR